MFKKIFTIAFVFLCAFGLTGCDTNVFKGGAKNYHKSPEALFERLCDLSENNGTYEEFIDLFPNEVETELREELSENNKSGSDIAEVFKAKKCTFTIGRDLPKEEIKSFEDFYNEDYDTNHEVLECKEINVSLDGKDMTETFTCKFKTDGKWYLIIG